MLPLSFLTSYILGRAKGLLPTLRTAAIDSAIFGFSSSFENFNSYQTYHINGIWGLREPTCRNFKKSTPTRIKDSIIHKPCRNLRVWGRTVLEKKNLWVKATKFSIILVFNEIFLGVLLRMVKIYWLQISTFAESADFQWWALFQSYQIAAHFSKSQLSNKASSWVW